MTLKQEFEKEQRAELGQELNGAALLFATRNQKYIEWLEGKLNQKTPADEYDFYTDLMRLMNVHSDRGLSKSDLIYKVRYALDSCELS